MPPSHRTAPFPDHITHITKFVNNLQLLPRSQHKLSYFIHHLHTTLRPFIALEITPLLQPAHHPTTFLVNPFLARCAEYSIVSHPTSADSTRVSTRVLNLTYSR